MFDELAELRRVAPDVTAASLLESATRVGARALGFGREYGTLRAGKRAAFVAVDVPSGVFDVEEFLVGGIAPDAIHPMAC
jgi:cytosine/adenosine deaminase-related metal-dependent hydrolase